MLHAQNHGRFYTLSLALLCFAYFIFQLFNNQYTIWSVDDFWFAHRIYEFKAGIPYRDFSPYKTVLGYYLLLPTMTLGHDALSPLLYTKNFIALLNTALFAITGHWLTKFFPKPAVITTLALLMSSAFVLSYSTNIRVDLLAYWLCLFSVLFLLDNKFLWAGITLGIAFSTSQKVLWYIMASDVALAVYWLMAARNRKIFWGAIVFNCALLITVMLYIAAWSYFADAHTVLYNMFYEAYIMFQLDVYDSTRRLFWGYTLSNNPLVFLLWPAAIITLFVSPANDSLRGKRIFILAYAAVIVFCLVPYKQVFPYYMLTTLPAFILLYAAFFSWVFALLENDSQPAMHIINDTGLWGLLLVYVIVFFYLNIFFVLPTVYLLIACIPIFLGIKITFKHNNKLNLIISAAITISVFFLGLVYPLTQFSLDLKNLSRGYQQSMVQLTEALLKDNGDYLAGIELIYNKNQPIPGLRHLDAPAIIYLSKPTPQLANAMLESLYHTPDISIPLAIRYLENSSVKFYVNNYRIYALPAEIKAYLNANYTHFWGSIYLYAPSIPTGQQKISLKFAGKYQIKANSTIQLDGKKIKPNTIIPLSKGEHNSQSATNYRMALQADDVSLLLNPRYKNDDWITMLG